MLRNFKNTGSIFLFLAGLVIFFHALVPHDHHYDNDLENHHHGQQEKDATGNETLHCYFFNDGLLKKIPVSFAKRVHQKLATADFKSKSETNQIARFVLKINLSTRFTFSNYLAFLDTSPSRGSPLV